MSAQLAGYGYLDASGNALSSSVDAANMSSPRRRRRGNGAAQQPLFSIRMVVGSFVNVSEVSDPIAAIYAHINIKTAEFVNDSNLVDDTTYIHMWSDQNLNIRSIHINYNRPAPINKGNKPVISKVSTKVVSNVPILQRVIKKRRA